MIYCKLCGYEGAYQGKICPSCHKEIILDENDIEALRGDVYDAKKRKESETVVEGYRILADFRDTEGEREWARMLEKGNGVTRDINAAMDFYRRAAEKLDAYSAYRYSGLISRENERLADFWLKFSAHLGYTDAYREASRAYGESREYDLENHYLYLAALSDDVDAIVDLAERYYTGSGLPESAAHAKWYMDKLTFPPLYAIKLAIKLRSVHPLEAPSLAVSDSRKVVRHLLKEAKALSLDVPVFYLTSQLFDSGEAEAGAELGEMYISGRGTKKNPELALRCLTRAAASGSVAAYIRLGKIYYEGDIAPRSVKLALDYLNNASERGSAEACELLGDIYHSPEFEQRDVAYAQKLYARAADMGSPSARKKSEKIIEIRDDYYRRAMYEEERTPTESFKFYYIATAMGHPTARLHLAAAYAVGNGVKRDRREAFLCFLKSAEEGCEEAYFPLGICYALGFGTAFDFRLAILWLSRADKTGDPKAKEEIIRLYENKKRALTRKLYSTSMRLIYLKKFSEAKKILELAASFDHPKAVYTLGCLYEFGRGTETDKSKAYSLYQKADGLGFSDDRSSYKLTVLKMIKK